MVCQRRWGVMFEWHQKWPQYHSLLAKIFIRKRKCSDVQTSQKILQVAPKTSEQILNLLIWNRELDSEIVRIEPDYYSVFYVICICCNSSFKKLLTYLQLSIMPMNLKILKNICNFLIHHYYWLLKKVLFSFLMPETGYSQDS